MLPYCWRDQTPLSNHELRMDDDVYKMRQDQTVTVTFPLVGAKAEALGLTGVRALAWTTTPWTLPTNLALAVGPAHRVRGGRRPTAPLRHRPTDAATTPRSDADTCSPTDLSPHYAKDLGYDGRRRRARRPSTRPSSAPSSTGVRYDRLFDYYADAEHMGHRERLADPRRRLRRRPATAPASCTRPPPTVRTTRGSARPPASR